VDRIPGEHIRDWLHVMEEERLWGRGEHPWDWAINVDELPIGERFYNGFIPLHLWRPNAQ